MSTALPIAVLGCNRPISLARVLQSLARAQYPAGMSVPLYINIDGGGVNGTADLARAFDWPYGPKTVNIQPQTLGMREHSLQTGDLSLEHGAVIFVEDDTYLSPAFYYFCLGALERYETCDEVFAVSPYSFAFCEFDGLPFVPILDVYDNYFLKSATTWSVMFMRRGWSQFRSWLDSNQHQPISRHDKLPEAITRWPATSWKRFLNKFLVAQDKYFCYPRQSYATNFADRGVHFSSGTNNFQVPLASVARICNLSDVATSKSRYDQFFELEPALLGEAFNGIDVADVDVDMRQIKSLEQLTRRFVLTTRKSLSPLRQFGAQLRPLIANPLFGVEGSVITLTERDKILNQSAIPSAEMCRHYYGNIGGSRELALVRSRLALSLKKVLGIA